MKVSVSELHQAAPPEIATTLRNAGHAGAGGAGFPTHAKWARLADAPFLLVNHQESEPNYVMDRWLGREFAEEFADFFDALLDSTFELIVVAAKEKYRESWMREFEAATDGAVYEPDDLPLDATDESGVVFAYTEDKYQFGMESVLLRMVGDVVMRDELPMDHGWIVQNTETIYNVMRTLRDGEPMTRKLIHVDGNVPRHRFLDVPIGTPATDLLEAAGRPLSDIDDDEILADGGPGWCFEITTDPEQFGVRKRTNCLLVLDAEEVEENTYGDGRINLLNERDWSREKETEPVRHSPDRVRVPLLSNPSFDHVVDRSLAIAREGDEVETGEMIAVPSDEAISNTQHAPIDGTVASVTDTHVDIVADEEDDAAAEDVLDHEKMIYWTWCGECGAYVARPEFEHVGPGIEYVCCDCR